MNTPTPRLSAAGRRWLVLGLLAVATVGILVRAVYLQIIHTDFLQAQGNERYMRSVEIPAHRGMIMDRNGELLAVSSPVDSVWADPGVALAAPAKLPLLARRLSLDADELVQELQTRAAEGKQFVYLRRHLAPDIAAWALELKVPGVHTQREYRRYYPTAEVTSHLLGFTDINDEGQEGLERTFNKQLQGEPGSQLVIKDRMDRIVEGVQHVRPPQPGKSLLLSIDRRIQYLAYRALKAAVIEHHAAAATAVVIDVTTGELLAMVNQPAGNPNNRNQRSGDLMRNRAVTDVFEPGSTFKPFIVAVALEKKTHKPETIIHTGPGRMGIGRFTVRDVHNYGSIDVTHVISKSSNVGVSKIALSLPREDFWNFLRALGFGARSGLGFSGEQGGHLAHYSGWGDFEYATHSFGYGVSVTALQLAQSYAIMAADGIKRPLSLVRREQPPEEETRVMSAQTAQQLRVMMELAVSTKGTGSKASVPGYRVAGKTGTARKLVNGRYVSDRYLALFAGLAPATRPRLAMVVVVDEPKGGVYYGGQVAAPVFGKVMAGALRLLNITPDAVTPDTNTATPDLVTVAKSKGL